VTGSATYLYAVTRPLPPDRRPDLRGVGGTPVRWVEDGGLAGLVSTVDLAEFGQDALAAHLEDLAWLERTAREHDEIVQASARLTTTLPLRLATICTDDDSARDRLRRLGGRALALLDRLDGREEWGVKLFATATAPPVPETAGAATGTAYLQQRRRQLVQRDVAADTAVRAADEVYTRLVGVAVDARRHRPQDQRLTGAPLPMVLNAAFLVDRDRFDDFRSAVAELAAARPPDSVVLTGPWPPYSFAALEES
jgi:hypothetical protein